MKRIAILSLLVLLSFFAPKAQVVEPPDKTLPSEFIRCVERPVTRSNSQAKDKQESPFIHANFSGQWASTFWEFHFDSCGTFWRKSTGHYGATLVEGKYRLQGDSLILANGFENTHGTVNAFYLLEKDTCIVDLRLGYDYCNHAKIPRYQRPVADGIVLPHISRERDFVKKGKN